MHGDRFRDRYGYLDGALRMNILKILGCLAVMFFGAWAYDLGGNALTVLGFGITLIGSLILIDTLVDFKEI